MKPYFKILLDLLSKLILWQAADVFVAAPTVGGCAVVIRQQHMPAERVSRPIWVPLSKWYSCGLESVN